jgi:hypothetical protein
MDLFAGEQAQVAGASALETATAMSVVQVWGKSLMLLMLFMLKQLHA